MFATDNAILLVIDIQGKLAGLMHQHEELFRNTSRLIRAAQMLDIPILITEQAPDKIGSTVPEITSLLKDHQRIPKSSFSCCGQKEFMDDLELLDRRQIIVCGIEAHVCVYQTVSDLIERNYEIQIVADAVSSRKEANKICGIRRMRDLGACVTSTEMIICELLKTSEHAKFKDIMALIK